MSDKNNNRQELLEEAKQLGLEFPNNIPTDKLAGLVADAIGGEGQTKEEDLIDNSTPKLEATEKQIVETKQDKTTVEVPIDVLEKMQKQIEALQSISSSGVAQPAVTDVSDLISALRDNKGTVETKGIRVENSPNRIERVKKANTLIRCVITPRDPLQVSAKVKMFVVSNDLIGDMKYRVPFNIETHIPFFIYSLLMSKTAMLLDESITGGDIKIGKTKGGHTEVPAYSINLLKPLTPEELKTLAKKQKLRSKDLDEREDAILDLDEEETTPKSALEAAGYDL
jgi:hypothetical protein